MNTFRLAIAAGILMTALPAAAQTRSSRQPEFRAQDSYGSYRAAPGYSGRGQPTYSTPPGYSGTIHWNTPNADGNLGSPSTGGASGSPGG